MKKYPAMAILEFRSIPDGMYVTDAMIKKSPVALLRSGTIGHRGYLTVLGGTPAAVHEATQEGQFWAKDQLLDHVYLPDVHPQLHDAILAQLRPTPPKPLPYAGTEAIVVLETPTVIGNVAATEAALKGATVRLIESRWGDSEMQGQCLTIYQGDLHEVQAALELALRALDQRGSTARHRVLTAPHNALINQIRTGARFASATNLDLDGETI